MHRQGMAVDAANTPDMDGPGTLGEFELARDLCRRIDDGLNENARGDFSAAHVLGETGQPVKGPPARCFPRYERADALMPNDKTLFHQPRDCLAHCHP